MASRVEMACRDCRKCTNSTIANLGRNSGRVLAAAMTLGVSEAGFLATKQCRQCNHSLSLHGGETIQTGHGKKGSAQETALRATVVPDTNNLHAASAGLTESEVSLNREAIGALPFLLDDDEEAVLLCVGSLPIPGKFLPRSALVLLTMKRLWVIPNKATPDEVARIDVRANDVKVTHQPSMSSDALELVWPSGASAQLTGLSRNGRNLEAAISKVRSTPTAMGEPQGTLGDEVTLHGSENEVITLLRSLGELHASGVLTAEEFAAQKQRLLEQL